MPIIDCQVHCYERNHAGRPWAGHLHGPDEVTGQDMVAVMDRLGIDGALLVSPWAMYRFDGSYALEVGQQFPDRFRLIKPFDPGRTDVVDDINAWAAQPGVAGARIMMGAPAAKAVDMAGVARILTRCRDLNLPVNVLAWGNLAAFADVARTHSDVQLVLDHLGILQPFTPPVWKDPFAALSEVIALAELPNVAIKISGVCTLACTPYPFDDIWPPVEQVVAAYGVDRCMWGTDWTRAVELVTPDDAVNAFRHSPRFSDGDKSKLMGATLAKIYDWTAI